MKGYVTKKGNRFYAVITTGSIPSPDANVESGTLPALTVPKRNGSQPSLPPTSTAATTTSERSVSAPTSPHRKPLAPKTVLEVHLIIRGALNDAIRKGLVSRNVALVADAPRLRSIPRVEQCGAANCWGCAGTTST